MCNLYIISILVVAELLSDIILFIHDFMADSDRILGILRDFLWKIVLTHSGMYLFS